MNDFATLFLPRSIPYRREKLVMSRSGECYLFLVFSNDPDTIWLNVTKPEETVVPWLGEV